MELKTKKLFFLVSLYAFGMASSVYGAQAGTILSQGTRDLFWWIIGIAALVAGVSFVIGAVQYLFSLDSQEAKKDGASRMRTAVFGLIICLISILVLNKINPQITNLGFGQPIGKKFPGIYYSNGNPDQDIPAPMSNPDILNTPELKNGYDRIVYYCGPTDKDPLIFTHYPQKNFKDSDPLYKNSQVVILNCLENTQEDIDKGTLKGESVGGPNLKSWGSFDITFQKEGVYFYLNNNCNGYRKAFTTNLSPIPQPFYGQVKSVEVLGPMIDLKNRAISKWGVIFHDENDDWRTGRCMTPVVALPGSKCFNTPGSFHSATIFSQEAKLGQTLNSTGASFYSKPWGWETGAFAGYNNQTINTNDTDAIVKSKLFFKPTNIPFGYQSCLAYSSGKFDDKATTTTSCETAAYRTLCPNFAQCSGSIKLTGKYLMILSNYEDYGKAYYNLQASFVGSQCQLFYSNIPSIKELEFIGKGNTLRSINLIPIK